MRLQMIRRATLFWTRNFCSNFQKLGMELDIAEDPRVSNNFFYEVLASRPAYYVGKTTAVEVTQGPDIVHEFLGKSPQTIDVPVVKEMMTVIPDLSSTNVQAVLLKLHTCRVSPEFLQSDVFSDNYPDLVKVLIRRCNSLVELEHSLKLEFTLADLLYRIRKDKTAFHRKILERQSTALKYLTESDFLQHLFFCNPLRSMPRGTANAVSIFIDNVIHKLHIDEVALICYVLYKCQYRLPKTKQFKYIVDALARHQGRVADISLNTLAKYIRYQNPCTTDELEVMESFLDVVSSRITDLELHSHLRLAVVGTQVRPLGALLLGSHRRQVARIHTPTNNLSEPDSVRARMCNDLVVTSSADIVIKNLDKCRPKDVCMCLYANAFFDFKISPEHADLIIARLRDEKFTSESHRWLIASTLSLAVMGYYNEELLIKSLDRDIIDFDTTHKLCRFDTNVLWTVCEIRFPHLLGNEIKLTRDDLRCETEETGKALERAKRLMRELYSVQKIIETHLPVKTRIVQTLDAFMHHDIHIENGPVVILHQPTSFLNGNERLLGYRKFRVKLIQDAGYGTVELNREFMKERRGIKMRKLYGMISRKMALNMCNGEDEAMNERQMSSLQMPSSRSALQKKDLS